MGLRHTTVGTVCGSGPEINWEKRGKRGPGVSPGRRMQTARKVRGPHARGARGRHRGTRLSFSKQVPKRGGESNSSRGPIPEPCTAISTSERTARVGGKKEREDLQGVEDSTVKAVLGEQEVKGVQEWA
jgi:hypothetical protein